MEPEKKRPLDKEIPIGNHHFEVPCWIWGVYIHLFFPSIWLKRFTTKLHPPFLRCLPWRDSRSDAGALPRQAKATLNQSHERCPRPTQKQSFKQLQVGTGFDLQGGWSSTKKAFGVFYGRKNVLPNKDGGVWRGRFQRRLGIGPETGKFESNERWITCLELLSHRFYSSLRSIGLVYGTSVYLIKIKFMYEHTVDGSEILLTGWGW